MILRFIACCEGEMTKKAYFFRNTLAEYSVNGLLNIDNLIGYYCCFFFRQD
jgi:hypothetical protein